MVHWLAVVGAAVVCWTVVEPQMPHKNGQTYWNGLILYWEKKIFNQIFGGNICYF